MCSSDLAEIARLTNACAQHTKNIRTWMRPGFQSHCTDAMMIMANRAEKAEARADELDALLDSRSASLTAEIRRMTGLARDAEARLKALESENHQLRSSAVPDQEDMKHLHEKLRVLDIPTPSATHIGCNIPPPCVTRGDIPPEAWNGS